jgi:hypothetical protein
MPSGLPSRERDLEARSVRLAVRRGDDAAVALDDLPGDRQSEADVLARGVPRTLAPTTPGAGEKLIALASRFSITCPSRSRDARTPRGLRAAGWIGRPLHRARVGHVHHAAHELVRDEAW